MTEVLGLGCGFRFLDLDMRVATNDPAVVEALFREAPRTQHTDSAAEVVPFSLIRTDDGYLLSGGDLDRRVERSLFIATQTLGASAGRMVRARHHHATLISAVVLSHAGQAVLLVGANGSGRSTLAIALAMAGMSVSGDHLVLVENGRAVPFPGRFQLWTQSLRLLAALPGGKDIEILHRDAFEHTRLAVDPVDVGRAWHVASAPVGAVILLEPNFAGRSRVNRRLKGTPYRRAIGTPLWGSGWQ